MREVFSAISEDPSDLDLWRKSFMLPWCVLADPARGGQCHWRTVVWHGEDHLSSDEEVESK